MKYETAGDPISGLMWTHKTTAKIAYELNLAGIYICASTVKYFKRTELFTKVKLKKSF